MRIDKLRIRHLRCFDEIELAPGPGLNWVIGPNGSGKTTLLEAVHLLSHGHSFRGGALDALIQRGRDDFALYAEIHSGVGVTHTLGMRRTTEDWRLRIDGQDVSKLASLLEYCATVCFEPGSHALIAGSAEERRRFLDWGVFHVEHDSLARWRNYRRALRQRNALLRAAGLASQFEIWEAELERFAEPIEQARRAYFQALQPHLLRMAAALLPELGSLRMYYQPGWDMDRPLGATLAEQRERDTRQGHTRAGPHRADWRLIFEHAPAREYLSRGQTKLAALVCALAQAALFAASAGVWPILCLDDLTSELDASHQRLVFEQIFGVEVQAWITTATPDPCRLHPGMVFHVEQGRVNKTGHTATVI